MSFEHMLLQGQQEIGVSLTSAAGMPVPSEPTKTFGVAPTLTPCRRDLHPTAPLLVSECHLSEIAARKTGSQLLGDCVRFGPPHSRTALVIVILFRNPPPP